MAIPLAYNLRNLTVRKTTTLMTALGIALTVSVLVAVLALVNGLEDRVPSVRQSSEHSGDAQGRERRAQRRHDASTRFRSLKAKPGIARGADGLPLASLELITVINLPSATHPDGMNITLRGLSPVGLEIREQTKITDGRWFRAGPA